MKDEAFVSRLREIADDAGSMYSLAKKSGISSSGIRKYFTGSSEPTRAMLIKLACAAGVSIEWLVLGTGPKYPETISAVHLEAIRKVRDGADIPSGPLALILRKLAKLNYVEICEPMADDRMAFGCIATAKGKSLLEERGAA